MLICLVPADVCLIGCIFYIADYQKYIEHTTLDVWRQVVTYIVFTIFLRVDCVIFTMQCYASAVYAVVMCLSLCLSITPVCGGLTDTLYQNSMTQDHTNSSSPMNICYKTHHMKRVVKMIVNMHSSTTF